MKVTRRVKEIFKKGKLVYWVVGGWVLGVRFLAFDPRFSELSIVEGKKP
jgi:hypothetical protein